MKSSLPHSRLMICLILAIVIALGLTVLSGTILNGINIWYLRAAVLLIGLALVIVAGSPESK